MRFIISFLFSFTAHSLGAQYFIKGHINNLAFNEVVYAHIETFENNVYQKKGISIVDKSSNFVFKWDASCGYKMARICFNSADTIFCILGGMDYPEINITWKNGHVINYTFTNSTENTAFELVKKQMARFKKSEDSIGKKGMSIHEFDPKFQTKTSALKQYYQELKSNYNKQLDAIVNIYSQSFCSRSIIPVLKMANMLDMPNTASNFDNNRSFQHYHFFDFIDVNEVDITAHHFFEKRIIEYMDLWVSQNDKGLREGVDLVMKKFAANETVSQQVLAILIDYFTQRNNYPLLDYINAQHIRTCDVPGLTGKSAEILDQMKRLSKGNPAPEISMYDDKGNPFRLFTYKPKNKVVLFFWASWCPHCVEMMPTVVDLYNTKKQAGIDFIAISLDDRKEDWLQFIQQNKLTWKNISDIKKWQSPVVKDYALRGTPSFYVLDNELKIIGHTNDLEDVIKLIE